MVLVIEVRVQLDDVGVVQGVVDFELACELLDHVVLEDCGFEDFFDGVKGIGGFVDGLVDVAEFTRAQLFAQVEVLDC